MSDETKYLIGYVCMIITINAVLKGIQWFAFRKFRVKTAVASKRKQWKQAAKAFDVRVNKLKKMSKDEIKKLYRKLAKEKHPDKGGNPDDFRNLHDAYEFAYAS